MVQRAEVGAVPGTVVNLRWFLAKPGAKVFPGWHAFGSPVWEPHPDEWTLGPGIFEQIESWSKNHIPCPDGKEFHGLAQWYESGIPPEVLADPTPYERPDCPGYALRVTFGSGSGVRTLAYDTIFGSYGQIFYDYSYGP